MNKEINEGVNELSCKWQFSISRQFMIVKPLKYNKNNNIRITKRQTTWEYYNSHETSHTLLNALFTT